MQRQSLKGYTFHLRPGTVLAGADGKGQNGLKGRLAQVKVLPRALGEKELEYAFGTPRRPGVRVFGLPLSAVPEPREFGPERPEERLVGLQAMDWRIAPESTPEELHHIARMLRREGFDLLFASGSFRYLFAEKYGDRNWWAAMPWRVYRQTLQRLAAACEAEGLGLVLHLTANLGLYPDLQREFAGMVSQDLSGKEVDWPNYYGRPICPNNVAFRQKYHARLRELFTLAPTLAGMMIDETAYGPAYTGCGCDTCRRLFAERFGGAAPPKPDDPAVWGNVQAPLWRDWLRFRCDSIRGNKAALKETVLAGLGEGALFTSCNYNPASAHIPRLHGANQLEYPVDLDFYECEPCHPWSWRHGIAEGKYLQSNGRPILLNGYSMSLSQAYFQMLLAAVMNWGNHQWSEFNQYRLIPPRWFRFWRPLNYGLESLAEVALVISPMDNVVSDYNEKHGNLPKEYFGWAQALTEAHVPFDVIRCDRLANCARRYRTLIIPNSLCWGDQGVAALQAFLDGGGRVVASGRSFSLTETGVARRPSRWRGRMTQLAELHGERYYAPKIGRGWIGEGGAWLDERDPEAKAKMLAAALADGEPPLTTTLPPEVVVQGERQNYRGHQGVVLRLLNLTGTRAADGGYAVPGARDFEFIRYPEVPGGHTITVKVPGTVAHGWMVSPDFEGMVRLETRMLAGGRCQIRLPMFARYAVVYLATAGDLPRELAPDFPAHDTLPPILPFEFRYCSVR